MEKAEMEPAEKIDRMIEELGDWRGQTLSQVRKAILAADPQIIEEWKWMGSPVWSRDGMIAVANAHKAKVKITFAYGARLEDTQNLFNGNDTGATRRSIDIFEGDAVNDQALKELVRVAIAYNQANLKKNKPARPRAKPAKN